MANPRQRRKAKSSACKAVSHSRRAKRLQKKMPAIRGPKALQDAWDPTKTLRQNYLALGLQHDLNPIASGGSEAQLGLQNPAPAASPSNVRPSGSEKPTGACTLPKGFGRIIRDSAGNVVRVELPSDEDAGDADASSREFVIDAPVVTTESELRIWAPHRPGTSHGQGSRGIEDTVVPDLENLAASAAVRERHTSLGERSHLERLVKKYGDDLDKMARDRRLNPEQRTANELRRAIAKAGGYGVLCQETDTKVAE